MANKKTDTNFKKDSNSFKKNEQKKKKRSFTSQKKYKWLMNILQDIQKIKWMHNN